MDIVASRRDARVASSSSQCQHDRTEGPLLRGCSAGTKATVMAVASSPDLVAAHRGGWAAARGSEDAARQQRGGGRYFIYRPPLGSLESVRSATGGRDWT